MNFFLSKFSININYVALLLHTVIMYSARYEKWTLLLPRTLLSLSFFPNGWNKCVVVWWCSAYTDGTHKDIFGADFLLRRAEPNQIRLSARARLITELLSPAGAHCLATHSIWRSQRPETWIIEHTFCEPAVRERAIAIPKQSRQTRSANIRPGRD